MALEVTKTAQDQVDEGFLVSQGGRHPIVRGIPRFCSPDNYADSFGYQWQTWATTQLDSVAQWGQESRRRLFSDTGWPEQMPGQKILEAGSGMGRFTEVLASTGAQISTFDYSQAVDANRQNNGRFQNVSWAQADIFQPPYALASFDKVLCVGVVQHTPSPSRAFDSLVRFVKPGGEIFIDCYRLNWRSLLKGKYYVRPLTRKMPAPLLKKLIELHVGWLFPVTGKLHELIGPSAAKVSWGLAMADYRGIHQVDEATAKEYALLDTFDMLAPAYDRPQTLATVRGWLQKNGLVDIRVEPGSNGIIAFGRKPA